MARMNQFAEDVRDIRAACRGDDDSRFDDGPVDDDDEDDDGEGY